MAEETSGQEKTEEPTARRLQDARKKGDIAKSMEVPSAAVLLASLLTLYLLNDFTMHTFSTVLRHYLTNLHSIQLIPDQLGPLSRQGLWFVLLLCGPLMLVVVLVALFANFVQFGFLFSTEKLVPSFSKIDPVEGIKRMFSLQMLVNTLKSIAKVVLVGYVAYSEVVRVLPDLNPLMDQEPFRIAAFIGKVSFWIFLKAALVIALLAAIDYAFQRYDFRKKMRMTKQELKEEAKQTEGDPHVKGRIRSIQMEMARRRMMEEVPKADVVIINPTRLAVALRYDSLTMAAPLLVAKGAGIVAHRIKEVAKENGIALIEDKPLAQALFKMVKLNEAIPENLFQAVAEVLAYVYSLRRKTG
ncbi:MAG: flagellar biosynthesis protein FlhB [Deltaproteobacteria bacterium]